MKKYVIKTVTRNIFGDVCNTRLSKEYQSLAIAKRYLTQGLEQTIIERTYTVGKDYKRHRAEKEITL